MGTPYFSVCRGPEVTQVPFGDVWVDGYVQRFGNTKIKATGMLNSGFGSATKGSPEKRHTRMAGFVEIGQISLRSLPVSPRFICLIRYLFLWSPGIMLVYVRFGVFHLVSTFCHLKTVELPFVTGGWWRSRCPAALKHKRKGTPCPSLSARTSGYSVLAPRVSPQGKCNFEDLGRYFATVNATQPSTREVHKL